MINSKSFSIWFFKDSAIVFFCSNDSIKKRRNMPSIKKQTTRYISFMARARSEWHGVIWKPQAFIFLKEADRRTLLLPILIITQCFISMYERYDKLYVTVPSSFTVFLPIKHFWFLFQNISSLTTYGSWLLLFDRILEVGAIWRGYAIIS